MKTVIKPWGKEEWLELNDRYCYKRIYINAGYKTSYQYHLFKRETNYIISGEAEIWLENEEGIVEKKIMKSGEYFNVTPPKKHRVIALTDIILQEVSTPEVDDVIRIEDDTNRRDGKIEDEHQNPVVLILASGLGSRLGKLTNNINKALLPINNKAIISHIIDKFPVDYDFVITKGYKGDMVEEYCRLTHPKHKFTFIEIDNFDGEGSGPGYSALKCKSILQRPFYLSTCDCLLIDKVPYLDGNWLGVSETGFPEKYSTLTINSEGIVTSFKNKDKDGYDLAFIGLAAIYDYEIFWNVLEKNMLNGELVNVFNDPSIFPKMKIKKLKWYDTGNLDDLNKTKEHYSDKSLSLHKDTDEITYHESGKFIKFIPNKEILKNKILRTNFIGHLIPNNFSYGDNFLSYDWEDGNTLYELDDINIYNHFLSFFKQNIKDRDFYLDLSHFDLFYVKKTELRLNMFLKKYGDRYYETEYLINNVKYPSFKSLYNNIDFTILYDNPCYENFHGDLQFDNIIYNNKTKSFKYIDWRESFAGNTKHGDIYYDLAKLYGGILISYNLMKDESKIILKEGQHNITYEYSQQENLIYFHKDYVYWLIENKFNFDKIKLITAIIYMNMSPLHDEKLGKLLWFKSIELLYEYHNNK